MGELYIGGSGLARGYMGRPDLTAERFLPNPFSEAGSRLYRTGDLARRLVSGVIEFLGRSDEQVKFHGYRVELGELRAALNRYPGVRDSVVVMRQDAAGRALLVAYYVARQEVPVGELRQFMLGEVVSEVVPQVFIHLRRLPLTLNGKVNFEALPVSRRPLRRSSRRGRWTTESGGRAGGRSVGGGAWGRAGWSARQLLRVGWAFTVGDAGGVAVARSLRRGVAAAYTLRDSNRCRRGRCISEAALRPERHGLVQPS